MLKFVAVFSVILLFLAYTPYSFAQEQTVKISTDKETYYYGDYLTFTIQVSQVTEELAIMHITDESGKKSSGIPIPIAQETTTHTSPFPFESEVFPLGKYVLDLQYSGSVNTTEFYLKDSGKIVIPVWIKDLGKMWVQDLISDNDFVKAVQYLIKNEIITILESESVNESNETVVPLWVKTTTKWWAQGLVSDNEFGQSLEHLIKIGVIVV